MATAAPPAAREAAHAWQATILDQIEKAGGITDATTNLVVYLPESGSDEKPELLGVFPNENEATVAAEDFATYAQYAGGEVRIITPSSLTGGVAPTGQSADTGQLFDIAVDDTQPNMVVLSFSGEIKLDRSEAQWVDLFNRLEEGKVGTLKIGVFTAASKKTHRRDSDGNVDAVVQTKSIKVTDLHLGDS